VGRDGDDAVGDEEDDDDNDEDADSEVDSDSARSAMLL
jgi:hypothetical protein